MRNKKQTGFTLIELLVVIAIIGLLASVVLLSLNSARAKSRDAKRLADGRQLISALELYFNDKGGYPPTLGYLVPSYMGLLPNAPTPADSPCTTTNNAYTFATAGGTGYSASDNSNLVWADYSLQFCLGGVTGGYSNGTRTASKNGIQ